MMNEPEVKRPVLTLPPEEAAAVERYYRAASVILEYGSGGSTALAADMPGKTVIAVESDVKWLAGLKAYFAAHPPAAELVLHHGRIGRTKAWGHPEDDEHFRKWPGYALSVWALDNFRHPDVVLIDGRFRPACFLATAFSITRPVTVLWDDYIDRTPYHEVEDLQKPVEMIGRMARFEVQPMAIPAAKLHWIVDQFLRPL